MTMFNLFSASQGKVLGNYPTLADAEAAWETEAARLVAEENTSRDWINGHLLIVKTKGAPSVSRAWNGPVAYEIMGGEII